MSLPLRLILLTTLLVLALSLKGIGLNPIRPMQLNKGKFTRYMFYINPETEIQARARVRITFPAEFDQSALAARLSCQAKSPSFGWRTAPCIFSSGSIIITLNSIKNQELFILVSQPRNPTIFEMSSFFEVCLMVEEMTIASTCDKIFGKVVFPNAPVPTASTSIWPMVSSLNTVVVGQSSTYQLQFSLSKQYPAGNTIRVTFPPGFLTSTAPICQMSGTYNQVIATQVWPDQRSIQCQSINKTLHLNQTLKIIGIFNPSFAGTFGNTPDGFKIQILQQTTTIILEEILVQKTIIIQAGTLRGSINQDNNFIRADVQYTFRFNLLNSLNRNNFILIRFDNSWILYRNMCSVIGGITMAPNTRLSCSNYTQGSHVYLNVSGFQQATVSNQLVFSTMVRSPAIPGAYPVMISTANINGTVDQMTSSVVLNSTYGDYSMLSIAGIVAGSDVPVSGTGPLQLTFFLNYELPQTNVLTQGKFVLRIFPQIPLPPQSINGVLKCYFFDVIPATTCTWDTTTSALYTLVTLTTPLTRNFQYSQIPITITTQGAISIDKIGITIADIVTRYRFQLQAYKQDDAVIPTQVYFSQYIAKPINLPLVSYSLTKEVNQYTHLRFEFTSPYNFTTPLVDNVAIKIQFLGQGGWAPNLGYAANQIYKRFPCVYSADATQKFPPHYSQQVSCDLYTYLDGPHASLMNTTHRGPYILITGFQTGIFINSQIRLQLGRFLIGSSTNLATHIRFSIVQLTPRQLTKWVEQYFNQFVLFTTVSQSIVSATTGGITHTIQDSSQINTVDNHTIAFTAPNNFFAVVYQYDQISTPSFPNQFVECTRINTATQKNWCTMLGYPVNYIVQYTYLTTFDTTVSSKINVTNGVYAGTFTGTARVFTSASLTILKKNFNIVYTPYSMASNVVDFWMDTGTFTYVYKGTETYYYVQFRPVYQVPSNGFLRFIFSGQVQLGINSFCSMNTKSLPLVVAQLGILCVRQSATSLKLTNIGALNAGQDYRVRVRLYTVQSSGSSITPRVTIQTHYSLSADPSIVNQINNQGWNTGHTNYYNVPKQFKIQNPKITYQTPRTDYIGPFQTIFVPTSDVLTASQIIMTLSNHAWNGGIWTTPNNVNTDPLVCMINQIRVSCTYTLAPLTVTMSTSPAGITSSQNNVIALDSEYLFPYNGIKHPTQGGQYNVLLEFMDASNNPIQRQSFYHRVRAPKLRNFYVTSSVNDIGVQNMFYVQFQLGATTIRSYTDGTKYSRIFIQFPTVDANNAPLFKNDLGGYTKTGQLVGCAFDTWTTYYVRSATDRLKCRLIRSQVPGDPVRVQIINHNAFDSNWRFMRLWIAKVFNPTTAVTSVPISIKIDHVTVSNNHVEEIYYDTFHLFMNSQTPTPTASTVDNCNTYCSGCTIFNGEVQTRNWFRFYPKAFSTVVGGVGYYYALDMTDVLKPRSLQNQYSQNYCQKSSGYYYQCLTFPDINYIVIWGQHTSHQIRMFLDYGQSLSQSNFNIVAKIWNQQRYIGTHTLTITPTCWNQMLGDFSGKAFYTSGGGQDKFVNKRKAEFNAQFSTQYAIPKGGSIQIVFPTSVPRIYPHCRSMTNLGSTLIAEGSGGFSGEIGCQVQTTSSGAKSWVITGFEALPGGSYIRIVGLMDYPASSGGYLGAGQILSYNSTHPTNIRANGFIIDYFYDSNFQLWVQNSPSLTADAEMILQQTLPLRVNHIGPLRFKFTLPSHLTGPNSGKITVRVPQVSTLSRNGGFAYDSNKKYVCQIVEISTNQQTGCIITAITTDTTDSSFHNFMFTMVTSGQLNSGVPYRMAITTHTGVQPQGLSFPTVTGTYKLDFNFDTTGSTNFAIHDQMYLQVYGTKFSSLQVNAFVTIPSHKNLIWVSFSPTTSITTTQQVVIEVPTRSAAGVNLFSNSLGTTLADGADLTIDIIGGTFAQNDMRCRLFHGDQTNHKPGRIVCGKFTSTIDAGETMYFAFFLGNPAMTMTNTMSIPFFIYSNQQGTTQKTNFDVIQNAVFLRDDVYTKSDVTHIASQHGQMQRSGVFIDLISRNVWNLDNGDSYVMYFSFPLRNNGRVTNGCTYPGTSTIYGDAWYHGNLWAIVCKVSPTAIGVPSGGYTTRNLRIAGFYTPFYYLSSTEDDIVTYSYHFSSKITTVGYITDGFPNQSPKTPSNPFFSMTPIYSSTIFRGAREDYTITFRYQSTASVDLSFIQKIAVIFPTSTYDYGFLEQDCVQAPGSQVQVAQCYIDTTNGVIWITPVVKQTYQSHRYISITTRYLAIRNPLNHNSINLNTFNIRFYSWKNTSQPTNLNAYCFLLINNIPSQTVSLSTNPSGMAPDTFTYLNYPHQRYYTDTPFSNLVHRAPFEMEFSPTVDFPTLSGSNLHIIKVKYPSNFAHATTFKIKDLVVFRPICYLHNQRIKSCTLDTANNQIIMSFQFSLTANNPYHLKFSILDSRNADIDGFLASLAVSNIVLMYRLSGGSNWYYTETDQFPALASLPTGAQAGPFRGIVAGTATYGHQVASQLNFVNLLLTFNRTDITGLVFQIPSVDKSGNNLFSNSAARTATFLSQQDGGSYPCGNNGFSAGGNVKCILINGDHSNLGLPTRIIMTDFTYVTQMNCRFVFVNHNNIGAFFSVMVRAYGGTPNADNPYGDRYMGYWQFNQIFKVVNPNTGSYVQSNTWATTSIRCPSLSPWRNNTDVYVFSRNSQIGAGRSSIAQVLLHDSSSSTVDDTFCEAALGSANSYDDMLWFNQVVSGVTRRYAYYVRTWPSNSNVSYTNSGGAWPLSYLKCKYFSFNILTYWFFSNSDIERASNTFSSSDCSGGTAGISDPITAYFSQSSYLTNGQDSTFVFEFDVTPSMTTITNFNFRPGDEMVFRVWFSAGYWGTMKSCQVIGGVISTSYSKRAQCYVTNNNQFNVRNVAGFEANPLLPTSKNRRVKISFLSDGIASNTNSWTSNWWFRLVANIDAFNSGHQGIIYQGMALTSITSPCYYSSSDGTCTFGQSADLGDFQLHELSDTFIRASFSPSQWLDFGTDTNYGHVFELTFNSFNFGPTCSINSIVWQLSMSTTPGSGVNNTFPADQMTCSLDKIRIRFSARRFVDYFGNPGGSFTSRWDTNQYAILYITVNPDTTARDLPTMHHEYIFMSGAYTYTYGGGYYPRTQKTVTLASQSLADTATISTLTTNPNRGGVTQFSFSLDQIRTRFGKSVNGYMLLAQFVGTSGWTGANDPWSSYLNTALNGQKMACKCISGAHPLAISASSPLIDTTCIRRLPISGFQNYAILIDVQGQITQDIKCFFPEFRVSTGMSFNVEFKLVYGDSYAPQLTTVSTKYSSIFRRQSNTLFFSASTPTMSITGFSSTQTPNLYGSAMNVGSSHSSSYVLSGSWGANLNTPFVYINFRSAGPIPIFTFCSDSNTYLQCRVYTGVVNLLVAQLKSTSVSSYSINNLGSTLSYPPSQYSVSSNYDAQIYIGNTQWSYSSSIGRNINSLTPISSNTFKVYTNRYGSEKATYQTNIFFAFNPAGQSLYSYVNTGSRLVISWSGLTTLRNCQVWVQGESAVELQCQTTTTSVTIISRYYDYSTSNNIFISLGMTNPSSVSNTFTAQLFDYYYDSNRFSRTISRTATYTTDTSFTSFAKVAKSTVQMYPFVSRISTIANAPMRIRFKTSGGTISVGNNGGFRLTYSQIQYSSAHYCQIIEYDNYARMVQQTQRKVYRAHSCTSSGSTITVYPAHTLNVVSSKYYQLVMMPLGIDAAGCTAHGCVTMSGYQQINFDTANFVSYNNIGSPSIVYQQPQRIYAYEGTRAIGLQHMYVLTTQPMLTSLYLSININFTSSHNFPTHYLEVTLHDLTISAFTGGYAVGDIIPCQLSSNFLAISNRQLPQCRVVKAQKLNNFVRVRIQNIGFLSPQIYWISLDDITFPTPSQSDNNAKFDISISYYGPSNLKYENFFPEIFQIDNTNGTAPVTSSSYTFQNPGSTGFGNPVVGQIRFNWPFDTNSLVSEQSKISVRFRGGFSAVWANIDTITFLDNLGTYQILWVNKALNKFVFIIPKKGLNVDTTINITALRNPFPYQRALYEASNTIDINFFHNYFLANSRTFNQPGYSVYTQNPALIYINQNWPSNTLDNFPATNTISPTSRNVLRLSVAFDQTQANMQTRKLNWIEIKFTSGISFVSECRVMRNDTTYVNVLEVCQPTWDGTNWWVQIFDVSNSQMLDPSTGQNKGWWIQIWCQVNSASLAYTAYVRASNNNQVQYTRSYTPTFSAYNTSRSVATSLSWTNMKHINRFFQTQWKFLDAVANQQTRYIKFRYRQPISSSVSSDMMYIYLPNNAASQPFSPKNSGSHMHALFLPALGVDKDFSIGTAGYAHLVNSGGVFRYDIYMRRGGLIAGWDYLLQIIQYNPATSAFFMATAPRRDAVQLRYDYNSGSGTWTYTDMVNVYSYRLFRSASFIHTTTTISDYNTITIKYKPNGALSAASSNHQISLRFAVQGRYHTNDGGITDIYTADGRTLVSGGQFSGWVGNANNNQANNIQFAQYSIQQAPLRFVLSKQSAYSDNVQYTYIVPLLKNPSTAFVSLRYNLTLMVSPANSYEYIYNHYQSINEYHTVSDTSTTLTTSITNNLRTVQTVNAVDMAVNLGSYSLPQWHSAIFKLNNALPGLLQNIVSPNDTSNYDYHYFKHIHMIMAKKKSTNNIMSVGIGSSSSALNYQSTFGLSWVRIFNSSNVATATNPQTIHFSSPPVLTLTTLTNYASSSLTRIQGYQTQGSATMYRLNFATPIIPQGGQIRILFDNTKFTSNNRASCRVGSNFVRASTQTSVMRCYRTSQGFRITGFNSITASTNAQLYFMLRSTASVTSSNIQVDIFGIFDNNSTRISLANVGALTFASGSVPSSLYRFDQVITPYFASIYTVYRYQIQGSFTLRVLSITNGHTLWLQQPSLTVRGNRRFLVKQNSTSVTGWTQLIRRSSDGAYVFPPNYHITLTATTDVQFLFRLTTHYASSSDWSYYNGIQINNAAVNTFRFLTNDGSWRQLGYYNFVPYTEPILLTVNNRYRAAGRQTVLDLTFMANIDAVSGDQVVVTFATNNLLNQMFTDDVEGNTTMTNHYRYLDCRQWGSNSEISYSRLVCLLYYGNRLANPPIPANLTIKYTKSMNGYPSANTVRILIGNVRNPTTVGMNVGLKVNINRYAQTYHNQPSHLFEARGFYVTTAATQNAITTGTSFTSSSTFVLATGLTHTFMLELTTGLTSSDAIYIIYPQNFQGVMPNDCSVSGYSCYVFPTRRWVALFPTGTVSSGSRTLSMTSMNNPYYSKPFSQYFLVTVARSGQVGDTYRIVAPSFVPVTYSLQNTGTNTAMTVQATQTPSMYLRNYANTVIFTISNVFSDDRMKAIYIKAPTDVTIWDQTYCNASLTTTSSFNYPLRFICRVDPATPNFLRLTRDQDMDVFSNSWGLMSIRVHAKFTIIDFPSAPQLYLDTPVTSGYFQAFSSVNVTSSSQIYYVSSAQVNLQISQNQVPIISVINFNQRSYANRQARVNNKVVFYLLFKPVTTVDIGSIVFTMPSEFNYPGVFQFDNCLMIGRVITPQLNCKLSRSQGQTLVTLVPTGWDNQVKILQLGTVDMSNWFTAPTLPGDFYNLNVAVYSNTGVLYSKQTRKISSVYGEEFNIPSIQILNTKDQNLKKLAVFDLQFVTGTLQIPPGARTTATAMVSQFQFIFQNFDGMNPTNVFSNDLGTGLKSGQQIGCVISSGMTALANQRIKCLLKAGTSQTDKPTIRVVNYDFINPGTTIIIRFAGLQSLPHTLVNTIKIAVKIFYTDIGSSTYLYIPTPIATKPTNSVNKFDSMSLSPNEGWADNWYFAMGYTGVNIVLQPATFYIQYRVPYQYWRHPTTFNWQNNYAYSSSSAPDQYILMTFYPATVLDKNNPRPVSCNSPCTGVEVFYAAGVVRLRQTSSLSGNVIQRWTLTNFPTSSFQLLQRRIFVYVQLIDGHQAIFQRNISLPTTNLRTVQKCTKFNFGVLSASSTNGGQIGVTYVFSIKTNHFVPSDGAVSITIPSAYGDMLANKATCTLIGFNGTNCYCRIRTPSRIDIYSNGTQLNRNSTYSVRITNLQNPNVASSQFTFIVTSYYHQNIFLAQKICQNQITPPTIIVKPLRTCKLSWVPQYYNQNYNASYSFRLSCSDVFRGDSILFIKLPSAFQTANPVGNRYCTSYESTTLVQPLCTLSKSNGDFLLSTQIDASSQSSLSLILNLVNPINNTYTASAQVRSKGTTYASSGTSSLTILSNSFANSQRSDVALLNVPKEAGLMSTYIFRIAPISTFTPSNLGITFPDNFNVNPSKVQVSIANSANNRFFKELTYNNIQALVNNVSAIAGVRISSYPHFTVSDLSLYLTNITGQVSSTQWTYVFISNIQNPSAFVSANFKVAYYLISNGFQTLQWIYQNPLTYYISSPPKYIAINSVNVSDYDLGYAADYTFKVSSSQGNFIGIAGKNLSYIIVIPTFYKSVLWANKAPICKFAQLNRTSSCYSYQSEIIVTEEFATNFTTLTLTISTLLNPLLPTTCDTTDITLLAQTFFVIRIIDALSDTFLYESSSVVDASNCLRFASKRIAISVQYALVMTAGLAYDIVFGLTKAAANLRITSRIDNSGFTFSPATINFNDLYTLTKTTKLFLRSDVAPGQYIIYFTKAQSSAQQYFRNILPVKITVTKASDTSIVSTPTISVPSMVDSTIGYPVKIPIVFSLPSSTQMTLFMNITEEATQSLAQFSEHFTNFSITPRIINIKPQQTEYFFTLNQAKRVVPPPITLNLNLISNYPIVHSLTTPTIHICFDLDPRYNVLYPPLRVRVTQFLTTCNRRDVGKTITNIMISNTASQSSATLVQPKIVSLQTTSVASTGATVRINSISQGQIYYACIPAGSPAITDGKVLTSKSSKIGVVGQTTNAAKTVSSGRIAQINYQATAIINGLSQSTNYVLYAVSSNNLGTSAIRSIPISTKQISKGVQMRLQFTTVVQKLDLVNALVQVLRVSPLRVKLLTSTKTLQDKQNSTTVNDNMPKFSYDIVIAPDATNDIVTPFSIVQNFANSSASKDTFQSYLPTFSKTSKITYFQLRPIYPKIDSMPVTVKINLYNATFSFKLLTRSNIYAILIQAKGTARNSLDISQEVLKPKKVSTLSQAERETAPSSQQIKSGTNNANNNLGKYKVVRIMTNDDGSGSITFTDLKPQSQYTVYMTASSYLPYDSDMLWPDDDVITFKFSTLPNPNLVDTQRQTQYIKELKKFNPELSDAMEKFVELRNRKKKTDRS